MPMFDFQCDKCGHVWEDIKSEGGDFPGPEVCVSCGHPGIYQLVSAPHIGGVAAQKIKDRAIRGGASVTPPVRVTVPNNYKNKNGTRGNRTS